MTEIKVFSTEWFQKHNNTLCWFANHAVLKYWFRRLLRIEKDIKWSDIVNQITPHSFTWNAGLQYFNHYSLLETQSKNPNETRLNRRIAIKILKKIEQGKIEDKKFLLPANSTDFRTHEKFGKRLYYGLKPLWYLLHFWDWSTAVQPKLNVGFDTLTAYPVPGTTVSGRMYTYTKATWALTHDATDSDGSDYDTTNAQSCYIKKTGTDTWQINRAMYLFTTNIGAEQTISSAVFSNYAYTDSGDTLSETLHLCSCSPASDTVIANADFDQFGTTSFGTQVQSTWNLNTYNDITLNASGISALSKTGISKLGLRYGGDITNTAPSSDGTSYINTYFSGETGTSKDPKLVVTYTTVVGPANLKSWDTVLAANIKSLDTNLIANVKSLDTIV